MLHIIHVEFEMITAERNSEKHSPGYCISIFIFNFFYYLEASKLYWAARMIVAHLPFKNIIFKRNACKSLFQKQLLLFYSSRQILFCLSHQGSPGGCHILVIFLLDLILFRNTCMHGSTVLGRSLGGNMSIITWKRECWIYETKSGIIKSLLRVK